MLCYDTVKIIDYVKTKYHTFCLIFLVVISPLLLTHFLNYNSQKANQTTFIKSKKSVRVSKSVYFFTS